jgi:predicted amidohydrolase YtcJ
MRDLVRAGEDAVVGGTTNRQMALVGGTIYASPTEEPLRDGVVLIEDGKIAAAGSRASV